MPVPFSILHANRLAVRTFFQRGSVLVVTLLLLLSLTLLALAASHATKTQTRAAAAAEQRDQAFQSAEAALRAGERLLAAGEFDHGCETDGRCRIYPKGHFRTEELLQSSTGWWQAHGWSYTESSEWPTGHSNVDSRFIIEAHAVTPTDPFLDRAKAPTRFFRITAASTATDNPLVLLQSVIAHTRCAEMGLVVAANSPTDTDARPACASSITGRQSWRQLR